jgi:hypothetical protein
VSAEQVTIKVSPRDIMMGKAQLHFSPAAKIALCHLAGAPWWEKDRAAKLHDLQQECLSRRERQKIIHGASRLGKSVLGGCEGLIEAFLPGSSTAIVAARYDHVAHEFQYIYQGMRELFKDHPQAFQRLIFRHSQNYHDYDCHTVWGSRVRGFSTDSDDGAALLGQAFTRMILGEGSHITQDILEKKAMRAIDGALMKRGDGIETETGYLSIYTTPKGHEGCSAAEYERVKAAGNGDITVFNWGKVPFASTVWIREASILENPAYDRKVFDARKRSMSPAAFEEQYLGRMTFASGRIYAEFNEDRHRRPMPSAAYIRTMRLGVGIDTGANFGAILAGLGRDGVIWLLAEARTQKTTITDSSELLKEEVTRVLSPVFGTDNWTTLANQIDTWMVDPASQHKMELSDLLDPAHPVAAIRDEGKYELLPTLEQVRSLFASDLLFMVDDLTGTYNEILKYIWKTVKSVGSKNAPTVKEPRKINDHLMDAMRFIVVPLMQLEATEEMPEPLSMQEAWDQQRKDYMFGPLRDVLASAAKRKIWC